MAYFTQVDTRPKGTTFNKKFLAYFMKQEYIWAVTISDENVCRLQRKHAYQNHAHKKNRLLEVSL